MYLYRKRPVLIKICIVICIAIYVIYCSAYSYKDDIFLYMKKVR